MAIDQERMVVVLEARLDKLEKGFQKARAAANSNLSAIVTDASKMEAALARVGSGGLDRVARSAGSLKVQTGNLAAQFNDIGVQLAGGQSPFLIALQQGTQITQALGPMGAGAAVKALGGAFVSLLNPLSLLTIAVIGLGGVAVQKLSEWYSSGELTEKQLEEQANLIRQVAKEWGNAVPELQRYVAELDKTLEKQKLLAAANALAAKEFEPLSAAVKDIAAEVSAAATDMQSLGSGEAEIDSLRSAFAALKQAVSENSDSSDEYKTLQEEVASILTGTTSPAIESLSAFLDANAAAFANAAANAGKYKEEAALAANMQLGALGTLTPLTSNSGQFMNPAQQQDWTAKNTKSQTQLAAEKAAKGGSRSKAISEAEREREAVLQLIDTLEFERSLIGMTDLEREKANALRRAGGAATDTEREKIEGLIEASYREKEAHESAEEAIKRQKDAMEQLGQIGMDAINGIAGAFEDGKITGEEMIQIVGRLIQQLLSMPDLGSLFGGGGGGIGKFFASLFGGGLKLPSFATGTNNAPGGLARINERGGEIVNLPSGAQVIPHDVSVKALRGAQGGGVNAPVMISIDARGADREGLSRVERQLAKLRAELPATIVSTVRTANKSNVKF